MTEENPQNEGSETNSLLDDPSVPGAEAGAGDESVGSPERYDFVLDRYRKEGRSEQDAALEQAKGYNEIRKQMGSFTGAPEAYTYELPKEMLEQGVTIEDDDPLLAQAKDMAKDMNMSQDGFEKMVNMYIEAQLADMEVLKGQREEQMKALGPTATQRLAGINQYISANFDAETVSAIQGMVTTAESVAAVEALIRATRNAPIAEGEGTPPPSVTKEEVETMLFEKTDTGQMRINVDPEFKKEYERKRDLLWGTDPARTIVNG